MIGQRNVTISSQDLFKLESSVRELEGENWSLKQKLEKYSDDVIASQVKQRGEELFERYMTAVFKELGFEDTDPNSVINVSNVRRSCKNNNWIDREDKTVELGTYVVGKFRHAFLMLGIKTDETTELPNLI